MPKPECKYIIHWAMQIQLESELNYYWFNAPTG